MKKVLKPALFFFCSALLSGSLVACSDDNDPNDANDNKEEMLQAAMTPYIDNTVVPTYKGMADNAIKLYESTLQILDAFENNTLTSALVQQAGDEWKESRRYWELSEAFLFGAAGDYDIDPHIDSWPLDKVAMDAQLAAIRRGEELDFTLGESIYGVIGYHALEYMLFELDATKNKSQVHSLNYTHEEVVFMTKVAEDLRNQCVRLEAAWAGINNVTSEKRQILESKGLVPDTNYGDAMKYAGSNNLYKNYQAAAEELIQGCIDIADEVGNTKIGNPHHGTEPGDQDYIESPYSLNSISDFVNNIRSIQNAYQGSNAGDASVSDYIKSINPELDTRVKNAIQQAITAIQAIPEPFAKNAQGTAAGNAVDVVGTDLVNVLNEVNAELSRL